MTIDYLKEMQEGYIEGEGYERHPLPEWYALDKAIEAIEQTRWIPVSERLPNDEDYVLVCYSNGDIRTAYYYIDTNVYETEFEDLCETGWYNYNEDLMYDQDIIAWMSLPEPYKAESEE